MFKQGDVILIPFPFTDLSGSKLRPALVVSSQLVNQTHDLVCAQITSKLFSDELYWSIDKDKITPPLALESGIRLHKLFTIAQARVVKKLGVMKMDTFDKVLKAINSKVLSK